MLRRSRLLITLLAGAALFAGALATNALAADAHTGPWPQARSGWMIGFGIGGGSAGLTDDSDSSNSSSNREGGGTGSFHVGYAFSPEVALEFYSDAWTKSENGGTVSFTTGAIALNYYPGGQGFLLRGGVGFGSVDFSQDIGNVTLSLNETGFSALASAGYEFRVKRTFALGPVINYSYISTDSFKANWVDGELAFTWYFLPKP
jgi:hypothetical protein